MPCRLEQFGLGDMLHCSLEMRKVASDARSMEEAVRLLCEFLYGELRTSDGSHACALVRCYKTHPYAALPDDLRRIAKALGGPGAAPVSTTRCLTLLATVGTQPDWNDRRRSRGHAAIPLTTTEHVERAPMIAALVRSFGLEPIDVVRPTGEVVPVVRGRNYGVFHVPDAVGSPLIPAQRDFVEPYGIRSAVGFGGTLPDGELFAIILFSRVPVASGVADRFRNLALDAKGALLRFDADEVFEAQ